MAPPMTFVVGDPRSAIGTDASSSGGGLVTSEMQGIAKRIEDRCVEREKECATLAVAHELRDAVDDELHDVREAHQAARIEFLKALQAAQGAELELHLRQVERRRHLREAKRWAEQDALDGARLDEALSSWHDELGTMAAAVVKRESYLLRLRGMIDAKKSAQRKRQRKKELLKLHKESLEARSVEAVRDADQAKAEIVRLEEEDSSRKAHVQQVADQVRAELAKVRNFPVVLQRGLEGSSTHACITCGFLELASVSAPQHWKRTELRREHWEAQHSLRNEGESIE